MTKDNNYQGTPAYQAMQQEIENLILDEQGTNEMLEAMILAIEAGAKTLHADSFPPLFKAMYLLNKIQHVAAVVAA